MIDYHALQESINRLNEVFHLMIMKSMDIVGGVAFNKSNTFPELAIKLPKLRKELKALKSEYNQLLTKIKIR